MQPMLVVRRIPLPVIASFALLFHGLPCIAATPTAAAVQGFQAYATSVENRLAAQHRSVTGFLAGSAASVTGLERLRRGETIVEQLTPSPQPELPGGMLHHWRATAFVPGAHAADFERLLRDFEAYPQRFAPQITRAQVLSRQPDLIRATLRVRQHHVLTVVLDTTYDVTFGRLDPRHAFSTSRSTQIAEIDSSGTPHEHVLSPDDQHGFLWQLNSYWSYAEQDSGLYLQIESISLTRSVPTGLGWAIGPFIQSIPRESLEFTLRASCAALRH